MFDPRERIQVFIDGANLHGGTKALGFDIDFKKLMQYFSNNGYVLRFNYYTAILDSEDVSSIRPLIDWLEYNGYRIISKPAKEFTDHLGRRKIKGNMDVELAVDVLEQCCRTDHVVILSGDGDFTALVAAVQRKGLKVTVVSTMKTTPPMIADNLRRVADQFIDLATIKDEIARDRPDQ
ncbi:NYN domain-containing protein [Rhizobium sp. MHM7A]|uniref:LabA-like NYN domain-containing protein n=1 Tax=Rhizobium sp. MHM7A TaxID=2583233 RepID=UPI0011061E1D|nr:NYN domain-containing protein [Rhizobium sp. MHM7A]TLX16839.1 NYN domain-containing protein [Rhizobium sp. MHM7A]